MWREVLRQRPLSMSGLQGALPATPTVSKRGLLSSFCRWGHHGSKKPVSLSKVTQPRSKARILICWPCCLRKTRQLEHKVKLGIFVASWRGQVAMRAVEPWGAPQVVRTFWYSPWKDRGRGFCASVHGRTELRFPQSSSALIFTQNDSLQGKTKCLLQTDRLD